MGLNSTTSATLAVNAADLYRLHLDQAATLVFDNVGTNSSLKWRLQNANGVVFDNVMTSSSNSIYDPLTNSTRYYVDFSGKLAAGDYTLILSSTGTVAANYAFRVLDASGATALRR